VENNLTPLVETRNLKKYFKVSNGMLHAIDGINLKIFKKKTLGVVGESGCGKSTLGRVILRLIDSTGGDIFFNGERITHINKTRLRQMRKRMQLIFQDPYSSIDPRMTVAESISEYMEINRTFHTKSEIVSRTEELMDMVGLSTRFIDSYPHELDGGRRQRIGIARALSVNPEFIVCDEPVSSLDVSIQAQILNLLMDLQDNLGLTYMFITHDLSVVKHISDEIMVMYLGHCVELAKSNELFAHPLHPYSKALLESIPVPDVSMRNKKIDVIRGEISSPINPQPGCRFFPRCQFANEKCRGKDIPLREIEGGHYVACTLFD